MNWDGKSLYPIEIIRWFIGYHPPTWEEVATFRITGRRMAGKSAVGEAICTRYLQNGSAVVDCFSANDNEALAWLRSPFKDNCVIIHGADVKVSFEKEQYKTMSSEDFDILRLEGGKIYIVVKALFSADELYYSFLSNLVQRALKRDAWKTSDVIFMREAQEFITSRIRAGQARGAREAAEQVISLNNMLYHSGFTLVVDAQREMDVAKAVRELTTYTIFKALGAQEIPRRLFYILRYIDPALLRALPPQYFILWHESGAVGLGHFMLPPWHVKRGEGLMGQLGIRYEVDEEKRKQLMRAMKEELAEASARKIITEDIHRQIIQMKEGGETIRAIAIKLGISETSVKQQLARHRLKACGCF